MTIFHGLTESLLFVVERWNKNQNVQPEILFHKCFTDLSYDFRFSIYEADTVPSSSRTLSQYFESDLDQ